VKKLRVRMLHTRAVVIDVQKEFEIVSIAKVKGIFITKCNATGIYMYMNNVV